MGPFRPAKEALPGSCGVLRVVSSLLPDSTGCCHEGVLEGVAAIGGGEVPGMEVATFSPSTGGGSVVSSQPGANSMHNDPSSKDRLLREQDGEIAMENGPGVGERSLPEPIA